VGVKKKSRFQPASRYVSETLQHMDTHTVRDLNGLITRGTR